MSSPRIIHAPADVGGHARGLALAERELGLASDVAVFSPGPFGYESDIDLRAGVDQPLLRRLGRRAAFLRRAIATYDVFHFNFGQTIMGVRQLGRVVDELPLLRRLGKTVLVTYQGCDVRPFACCACRKPHCVAEDPYRLPAAERVLRHADRVFHLNPDLGRWLPGSTFVPYASFDARAIPPVPPSSEGELHVLHAPTDRDVKGSAHVVAAVEALRSEGVAIRLELLEGVPRSEVLERCAAADVVVDQLVIGWYGGFAVEAMGLGKPVIAHIDEDDNPFGERLPILRATPATLTDLLRDLVGERERLLRAGAAAREFACEVHDPRAIARTVLDGIAELG